MKKILLRVFGVILVFVSLFLICYPFISNYVVSQNQNSEILTYTENSDNTEKEKLEAARVQAEEYNQKFLSRVVITDPFSPVYTPPIEDDYLSVLNVNGDGVMGYVEIPVIDVSLPIYHGTEAAVLQKGAGHMQNTSIPIGGINTHAVITGHTGLSSAKLFTDLNQLIIGDVFYIHTLGDTLAYQVDSILVVKPNQTDSLRVQDGLDLVSLVTCTPYGINTHRLIVRGKRIPYEDAKAAVEHSDREIESTWMREYKRALFFGSLILVLILVVFAGIRIIINRRRKKKSVSRLEVQEE